MSRHLCSLLYYISIWRAWVCCQQSGSSEEGRYADISATRHFVPLGIETLGIFGVEEKELLLEIGHLVMEESGIPGGMPASCREFL